MKITFDNKMVLNHKFKMVRRVLFYSPIKINLEDRIMYKNSYFDIKILNSPYLFSYISFLSLIEV